MYSHGRALAAGKDAAPMKPRHLLSASEIGGLHAYLDQRLETVGLPSQPEVVISLLELATDPDSQINDYAKIVKADHAVAGRVLRLANSAFFAQRAPISSIERACLVLGMERLKSVALGFHLSRAALCGTARTLSRDIWTQSVMRACIAGELARVAAPSHVAESFVVGLMLDAGIPLMPQLIGKAYDTLLVDRPHPQQLHRREHETLPFTHTDVVAALARRWKLPEVLAHPLEWHHVRPAEPPRADTTGRLHRIAAVVGAIELTKETLASKNGPSLIVHARTMGLTPEETADIAKRSGTEYATSLALFSDIAASLGEGEDLIDRVHASLLAAADAAVIDSLRKEQHANHRLIVDGQTLEATRDADGSTLVVLYDANGQQLLTHRFASGDASPAAVAEAFGIELRAADDTKRLADYLLQRAA